MPLDGCTDDIEHDFDLLEAIGRLHDTAAERISRQGAPANTLRRWLLGHRDPPEEQHIRNCLAAMAVDLELFTPSMTGRVAMERHLDTALTASSEDRDAANALRAAQFRLVRIIGRDGPDVVRVEDLATGERLSVLQSRISPRAEGVVTSMRLCPLASGRHVLISPLYVADDAMMSAAMGFVRPGRSLGHGHRCAASLYRSAARQGFLPMPLLETSLDDAILRDNLMDLSEVEQLAIRWLASEDPDSDPDLIGDIRKAATVDDIVDACGCFGKWRQGGRAKMEAALARVADILVETVAQRALAGLKGYGDVLDRVGSLIDEHVSQGAMNAPSRDLFARLRTRWSFAKSDGQGGAGPSGRPDLDQVIARIRALRAKTVERGCTEAEAMAAAAKVAELLDRHDLSLDALSVRQAACAGEAVDTGRRRRAPVDNCATAIADFCDCRVWTESGDDGVFRYIFFGLKGDVVAARFLHDLIEDTFETESAGFRKGETYRRMLHGQRRTALNSFQTGLASGIVTKLGAIKSARSAAAGMRTGFDLVAAKEAVLDDEIERLGLRFQSRTSSSRRRVHLESYEAGKAAGACFEPHPHLAR